MPTLYLNPTPPPVAWLSDALRVHRPNGPQPADVGLAFADLPASQPQEVHVRAGVTRGAGEPDPASLAGVKTQVWAYAFGTAATPATFLAGLGGNSGVLLGGGTGQTVFSNALLTFTQAWDIPASEVQQFADTNGDVHACLYGNAFAPGQGNARDTLHDPALPGDPFDPAGNRLHAQRNVTIRAVPPGKLVPMMFWAGNPDPKEEGKFQLELVERSPRELTVWELEEVATTQPWLRTVGPLRGGLGLERFGVERLDLSTLGTVVRRVPQAVTGFLGGLRVARVQDRIAGRALPGIEAVFDGRRVPVLAPEKPLFEAAVEVDGGVTDRIQSLELGAGDARRATLHLEVPEEEFVLRVFDIVQRGAKGRASAGARIVALSAPAELKGGRR